MTLILQNIPKIESELKCTITINPDVYELDFDNNVFSTEWQIGTGDCAIKMIKFLVDRVIDSKVVRISLIGICPSGYSEEFRVVHLDISDFKSLLINLVKKEI